VLKVINNLQYRNSEDLEAQNCVEDVF